MLKWLRRCWECWSNPPQYLRANKPPKPRKVWLKKWDGALVIAKAIWTDAGWSANWTGEWTNKSWSILLTDGKVIGTSSVVGWLPHTGWENDLTK